MVGFQTKLKYCEQIRIFRVISDLEKAKFARLDGRFHCNTYLNSPIILDQTLPLKNKDPNYGFAEQITECEGYVESSAIGLLAGHFAAAEYNHNCSSLPRPATALGTLLNHIGGHLIAEENKQKKILSTNEC